MNKKFNFDLTINSSALLCPNPTEWFAKAYLTEDIADNYRVIPGVKSSTKISTAVFPSVLVAETCDFASSSSVLSAVTMSVFPVQAQVQICKKDLESSYVSLEMAKGSQNWDVQSFMNLYWENLAGEIGEEIEYIRWVGNTAITGYTGANAFKGLCNGYESLLTATTGVINVTLTAVTANNVIDAFAAVLAAAPAAISSKKKELRFYVASNVATAFRIAASKGNTITYITEDLSFNFGGIKIVEAPGMSNNKIVLTLRSNLVYLLDGEDDATDLRAVNLMDTTAQPLLRTAVYLKLGFGILNANQIVYFN